MQVIAGLNVRFWTHRPVQPRYSMRICGSRRPRIVWRELFCSVPASGRLHRHDFLEPVRSRMALRHS